MGHRSGLVKGYEIEGDDDFFVCLAAKRVGKRTNQITLSLTWVCFSLWVLICFKFMGLVFSCGFDDFSRLEVSGFDDFSGLFFHVGLMIFFMLEVSMEDRDFVLIFACLFAKKIQEKRI